MSFAALVKKVAIPEPEIAEELRGALELGKHPSIMKINLALKHFKARFDVGDIPDNAAIHDFLDSIQPVSDLDTLSSRHFTDLYFSERFHKALDATLHFVIVALQVKLSQSDLLRTLNGEPTKKSLVSKAVERTLIRSLKRMLSCGATLGKGRTPMKVFKDLETAAINGRPFLKRRVARYRTEIRDILDSNTLRYLPANEYFSYHIRHLKGQSETSSKRCGVPVNSLPKNPDSWDITRSPDDGLTWIHVPSTNGMIVKSLVKTIRADLVMPFTRRFQSSNVAPGDPLLTYREVGYWPDEVEEMAFNMVVFPCLALSTYGRHTASRDKYKAYRDTLTSASSGKYASDCTVHFERTLDEAYFPGLSVDELAARNADQIVSSKFKINRNWPKDNNPILIVPQLWMWRISNVILTAHSTREESGNLRHLVWQGTELDFPTCIPLVEQTNANLQMGLIITDFIHAFGKEMTIEDKTKVSPPLDLFESQVVSLLSEVKTYIRDTKRNAINYDIEERFHHVLSDCLSELAMIQHILDQQEEILNSLLDDCSQSQTLMSQNQSPDPVHPARKSALEPPLNWVKRSPHWTYVSEGQELLKRYKKSIQKIDGDAERIEKNVQDLLNLKRTYASVQDSHASVLLSVAAIGFAIVTIIFAPLAFLTALFALNMEGFDRLRVKSSDNSDAATARGTDGNESPAIEIVVPDDPAYDSRKMAGIFISTEILTIFVTCLLVWASLRWFGIEFSDFRVGRETKQSDEMRTKSPSQDDTEQTVTEKTNASDSERTESEPRLRKTWHERSMWRGKKKTAVEKGVNQA